MKAADNQNYYPEWLVTNWLYQDRDFNVRAAWPKTQAANVIGMHFENKFNHVQDMPTAWAVNEGGGGDAGDLAYYTYINLLQLASGIQLAGPDLTPENLQRGMFRARFPNPGCKGPPHYQACVDYGPGDWSHYGDGTLVWWSHTAQSWTIGNGTFCYVRLGQRYNLGEWPSDDSGFREGPCR